MTGASETTVPTPRKGISALAVLSLVASFGVCPVVTVLSIPLGFLGLRDVRINNRRGRTLAWIGIVLGVVITPLTTWFMIWWNVEVRIPLKHGPQEAIIQGMSGDISGFKAGFHTDETGTTDMEAAAFIASLQSRWGGLKEIVQDDTRAAVFSDNGWSVRVPYFFEFERATVPGEADFMLLSKSENGGQIVCRFAWVIIGDTDPEAWPPDAASEDRTPLSDRTGGEGEGS